jgi:hypothetical protein
MQYNINIKHNIYIYRINIIYKHYIIKLNNKYNQSNILHIQNK